MNLETPREDSDKIVLDLEVGAGDTLFEMLRDELTNKLGKEKAAKYGLDIIRKLYKLRDDKKTKFNPDVIEIGERFKISMDKDGIQISIIRGQETENIYIGSEKPKRNSIKRTRSNLRELSNEITINKKPYYFEKIALKTAIEQEQKEKALTTIKNRLDKSKARLVAKYLDKDEDQFTEDWATAIYNAMETLDIETTTANIDLCVTQIQREGSFLEDPVLPDMDGVYSRYRAKFIGELESNIPLINSSLGFANNLISRFENKYKDRILACKTERELDKLIGTMFTEVEEDPRFQLLTKNPLNKGLENKWNEFKLKWEKPIKTIGAMQVSPKRAKIVLEKQGINFDSEADLIDYLYTKEGNLIAGIGILKEGIDSYVVSGKGEVIHAIADYNAGRFASRNASIQNKINKLTENVDLDLDGDLLIYDQNTNAVKKRSKTEQAITKIFKENGILIYEAKLRQDLLHEKNSRLEETETYKILEDLYLKKFGESTYSIVPKAKVNEAKEKFGTALDSESYTRNTLNQMQNNT